MIKPQNIREEDLQDLKKFQQDSEDLIVRLGQLSFKKLQIEKEEQQLKQYHEQLISIEIEMSKKLKEVYGDVQIDLKDGKITYP
jgi:hypothetical protein